MTIFTGEEFETNVDTLFDKAMCVCWYMDTCSKATAYRLAALRSQVLDLNFAKHGNHNYSPQFVIFCPAVIPYKTPEVWGILIELAGANCFSDTDGLGDGPAPDNF
jgi:hypothetical protein